MNKKLVAACVVVSILFFLGLGAALVGVVWWTLRGNLVPENISEGVVLEQEGLADPHDELEKSIASAPTRRMSQGGLVGAMGGIHVKLSSGKSKEVLLPMPQLADGQVPICFFIKSMPPEAVKEFRIRKREDCNVVLSVHFAEKRQDVQIAWSAVVLIAPADVTPNATPAEPYRAATSCVQSQAEEIEELAALTWPESGEAEEFAKNIQRHIREMKRRTQPRSLDALGILKSGESGICTANANLAAALLRSKGIACRSIAVIPPISQRLEMHRIVEYFDDGRWVPFDPSSLQADIPAKPWHHVIMAKTTPWDEQVAMTPRLGSMVGCPYGQEIEMLSSGVNLAGQDFFWTIASPLAEFEPSEEAIRLAIESWNRYLETGAPTPGQREAASARTALELEELLGEN